MKTWVWIRKRHSVHSLPFLSVWLQMSFWDCWKYVVEPFFFLFILSSKIKLLLRQSREVCCKQMNSFAMAGLKDCRPVGYGIYSWQMNWIDWKRASTSWWRRGSSDAWWPLSIYHVIMSSRKWRKQSWYHHDSPSKMVSVQELVLLSLWLFLCIEVDQSISRSMAAIPMLVLDTAQGSLPVPV